MAADAGNPRFADFIRGGDWVKMIAVLNTDLTAMKVIPEMRDNKLLANPGGTIGSAIACLSGRLGPIAMAVPILMASCAVAADEPATEPPQWLTGAPLERQLETPIAMLRWSSNPLRAALNSLARSQQIALFLDRRVDPDQTVELVVQDEPVWEVIQRLASGGHFGSCRVGPVVYLGPAETAAVLGTVVELRRESVRQWPTATSRRLRTRHCVGWPELAEPRDLIAQAAREAGVALDGLELVPHDLWPAVDLPPLDFVEEMSLLLAGFGLTFEMAEREPRIRLVPLPASATIERSYRLPGQQAERVAELLRERFPEAAFERRADGLAVRGPIEVHRIVERWMRGESAPATIRQPVGAGEVQYTLEIKNKPVGAIATALAERLGLQIQYDPRVLDKLDKPVSFRVERVSREDLLRALLRPAGLSFQITDNTLMVTPGANAP